MNFPKSCSAILMTEFSFCEDRNRFDIQSRVKVYIQFQEKKILLKHSLPYMSLELKIMAPILLLKLKLP